MPPMSEEERKARKREYHKAYYKANKERVAERIKAYRVANKEKVAEYRKAYRVANKEKVAGYNKAYNKAYYKANKEKEAERSKAYYEANKEKIAEYRKAYYKAYYEANKERFLEHSSLRRARKRNSIPKPLRNCEQERQRLRNIYKLRAVISEATGIEHHVDHMWPLSDGGPHWSGNLQIITAEENLRKNACVCEETKKVIQESLEYTLQEYKRRQHVRNRFT